MLNLLRRALTLVLVANFALVGGLSGADARMAFDPNGTGKLYMPGLRHGLASIAPVGSAIAAATTRPRMATVVAGATQPIQTSRMFDQPVVAGTAPFVDYFNGWVNTGISGAAQEVTGSFADLSFYLVTNVQMTGSQANLDQTGATITPFSMQDIVNSVSDRLAKLTYAPTNPTWASRTYAQLQADGGGVNGNVITLPPGYALSTDRMTGTSLPANTPFLIQVEDKREASQVPSSVTIDGNGLATFTFPATRRSAVGETLVIGGFAPTTYNSTQGLKVVSLPGTNQVTVQYPAGTAAPTTIGTVYGSRPSTFYGRPDLGDLQKADAVGANANRLNWNAAAGGGTVVNPALTTKGLAIGGVLSVKMSDPTGKNGYILADGSSVGWGVQDGDALNAGGGTITGDALGRFGWLARGLAGAGYPHVLVAVPGSNATNNVLYGDYQARLWAGRGARGILMEETHNTILSRGTAALAEADIVARLNQHRAQTPGIKTMLTTSPPFTTAGTSSNWSTRSGQVQSGPYAYPGGLVYSTYNPDVLNRTGGYSAANGGPDGSFDMALYIAQLDGTTAVDGNWPANGTAYNFTREGTHGNYPMAAGLAAALTPARLSAVFNSGF